MDHTTIKNFSPARLKAEDYSPATKIDCGQRTVAGEPLRQMAEEMAASLPAIPITLSAEEMRKIVYELRVHQVELELQNEELCRVQTQLDSARARYFDLYNTAPMGYCTLSKAGLILDANLAAAELLEVHQNELINRPLTEFILSADQDIFYSNFNHLFKIHPPVPMDPLKGPLSVVCELRLVKRGWDPIWVRINATALADEATPLTCRIVISDINDRKRMEEELRENQKLLAETENIGKVGGWEFDIDTGKQIWTEEVYHIHEVELNYQPTVENGLNFYTPESRPVIERVLRRIVETGDPFDEELEIITAKGNRRIVQAIGKTDREHRRIYGSFQDITLRKSAEAELLKMHKLQSLGTLAGGIAHDFNNILMGLFGNISLAKQELSPGHPGIKPLVDAEESMNRAIRLTQQLMTFSKGGELFLESISLAALVEEVAKFDLAGSNVILVLNKTPDLWLAKIDKDQIQQVISNLTINARQSMPGGGHLFINLENADVHEGRIPGLQKRKYIKVSVRDEGSGVDPKIIERIFDPYFATMQTSSGLGLATTHSIIRKHGGSIEVKSEQGKGVTFEFYLPASESLATPKIIQTGSEIKSFESSPKVLVMDDEIVIRTVIPRWLSRMGCVAQTAADGQQAIELYRQSLEAGSPFDVAILDLTVPHGMGGEQAMKEIMALDHGANVIVSSGYSDGPVMSNFKQYGFKDVLPKPYTENQLLNSLKRILK